MSTLASLIRDGRRSRSLTQAQLASRVGVTQATVNRWENGTGEPQRGTITQLVQELGLDGSEVLAALGLGELAPKKAEGARRAQRVEPPCALSLPDGMRLTPKQQRVVAAFRDLVLEDLAKVS
ncbi:MAG: helix-turn-helix transcriptional regulator [Frankia sp.]|nr:helix-turn-helix transcriptional regulator [Frankia sp.]